jgi:hypothetical protein
MIAALTTRWVAGEGSVFAKKGLPPVAFRPGHLKHTSGALSHIAGALIHLLPNAGSPETADCSSGFNEAHRSQPDRQASGDYRMLACHPARRQPYTTQIKVSGLRAGAGRRRWPGGVRR